MKTLIAATLAAAALGGCVDLKASYPDRRFYVLDAPRAGALQTAPVGSLLRVRRFTASPLAEGREFVYRTGGETAETDFYHAFQTPPASQIAEQTERWLAASSLFEHVVGPSSAAAETLHLEGHLVSLHAEEREGSRAAVVELQFLLVDPTADPPWILFQKSYRREATAAGQGGPALVRAWNESLSKLLTALEEDLAKVDRAPRK